MQWLEQQGLNVIQYIVDNILNSILSFVVQLLNALLVNPENMQAIPGYQTLTIAISGIATTALAFILVKELLMNQLEDLGDMGVSPLVILKNTMVAAFLIWASPLLITEVILPMVTGLTQMLNDTMGLGSNSITVSLSLGTIQAGSAAAAGGGAAATGAAVADGGAVTSGIIAELGADFGFWTAAIVLVGFTICYAILAIQSGIRWAELFFLALVGPALAISRASSNGSWNQWLKEAIATCLSQLVQYFACILAIVIISHPNTISVANGSSVNPVVEVFMLLGILIFAITGPKTLRNILGNGGAQGGLRAVGALAKSAAGGL